MIPIAVFIYGYFPLALRRYLGLGIVAAVLVTACFAAFNMNFDRIWYAVVGPYSLNGSIGYLPAATALMVIGGAALSKRADMAGRGLLLAAAIFAVSLTFRSIDEAACATLPMGTHFLWHTLNAVVLFVLLRTAIADRVRSSREGDLR